MAWIPIDGYEELYSVNEHGEVLSHFNHSNRILKPRPHKAGYYYVILYKPNTKPKCLFIHRLVAKAFIENPNGYAVVNHKDMNKHNNCAENLEWCTTAYNNRHAHGSRVGQYDKFGNKLAEYSSIIVASEMTGILKSNISHCCSNPKQRTAGGYVWKYERND